MFSDITCDGDLTTYSTSADQSVLTEQCQLPDSFKYFEPLTIIENISLSDTYNICKQIFKKISSAFIITFITWHLV